MKKKILVLTSSYTKFLKDTNGGFVYELSKRLSSNYDIIVLAPWEKGLEKEEEIDDIKIYRHKQFFWNVDFAYGIGLVEKVVRNPFKIIYFPFFFIFQSLSIIKILKKDKIDLIHAHWIFPQGIAVAIISSLFSLKKVRKVLTIHGSDINKFDNKIGWFFIRFIIKKFDVVTVVSNDIKNKILKNTSFTNIHTSPMGVNTTIFKPEQNNQVYKSIFDNDNPNVLFVGICVESKGLSKLIEAVKLLKDIGTYVNLLIIGDDTNTSMYKEYIAKHCLEESVRFFGAVGREQMPNYYTGADIFILPSKSEGFGLVYAESMSCETITIASDLVPVHDIITDNETGFFLEENTPKCIAEKISYVLGNKENLKSMRQNARKYIVDNFDWEIVAEKYSKLFTSLIEE